MQLKKGVTLKGMSAVLFPAMLIIDQYFQSINKAFVITSITDSVHKVGSKHYKGEAFDFRISNLTTKEVLTMQDCLISLLYGNYDVILEKDHFHIEFEEHKS